MTPTSIPLIIFYQPTGSLPRSWHSYLPDLLGLGDDCRATFVGNGTGGAPHFECWALFTAPSDHAREALTHSAATLALLKFARLPRTAPRCAVVPTLALPMDSTELNVVRETLGRFHPTLDHFPNGVPLE